MPQPPDSAWPPTTLRKFVALASLALLIGCDATTIAPGAESPLEIEIPIPTPGPQLRPAETVTVTLEGPTPTKVSGKPGDVVRIPGLHSGPYVLTIEGWAGGFLVWETESTLIVGESPPQGVAAEPVSFAGPVPVLPANPVTVGDVLAVRWEPIVGATEYKVDWARLSGGVTGSKRTSQTLADLTLEAGLYSIQVSGISRLGSQGPPTSPPVVVSIVPKPPKRLSLTKAGGGSVESSPSGLSMVPTETAASAEFEDGTAVTLTARAEFGGRFLGWGGDCSGTAPSCQLAMTQARSASATFLAPLRTTLAAAVQTCTVGGPCAFTPVTASGGVTPYAFTVTGAVPPGLSFNSTSGAFSGSPSAAGTASLAVTVTDAAGGSSSRDFQLTVATIPKPPLRLSVTKSGGGGVTSIPAGIALGTAQTAASAEFTDGARVTLTAAADPAGRFLEWGGDCAGTAPSCQVVMTQARSVSARFSEPLRTTLVTGVQTCTIGSACAFTPVTASGGEPPYAFSVAGGVPSGLGFNAATGAFSGTPSAVGTASLTVTVTDAAGARSSREFQLVVSAPNAPPRLSVTKTGAGSVASTPAGIELNTAQTAGSAEFPNGSQVTLTAAFVAGGRFLGWGGDCSGTAPSCQVAMTQARSVSATFSEPLRTTVAIPVLTCVSDVPCAFTPVTASGGVPPYVFATDHPGIRQMSFDPGTGKLAGTPHDDGTANITVTVTDAAGGRSASGFTFVVVLPLQTTLEIPSQGCLAGTSCAFTPVTASGGVPPRVFSLAGALPEGMSFSTATGAFSGSPTSASSGSFTITATDASGATSTRTFQLVIELPLSQLRAVLLIPTKTCYVGASCAFTPVGGTGGRAPYRFAVGGAMPAGMSFDPVTGGLSGTPTASSSGSLTITVTDAVGATAAQSIQLAVADAPFEAVALIPYLNPLGYTQTCILGTSCAFTPFGAKGGRPPYRFAAAGEMPSGVGFDTGTGAFSGTPTTTMGGHYLTITITDALGGTVSENLWFVVNSAAVPLDMALLVENQTCAVGLACRFKPLIARGGRLPYRYSASNVPAGLTIDSATGEFSGTPTSEAQGTWSPSVTVTDAAGATYTGGGYHLTINPPVQAVVLIPTQTCSVGSPCAFTPVKGKAGLPPYTFAMSGASPLPAGMAIDTGTGALAGTPTAGSNATHTVAVTDAGGVVASQSFQLTVVAAPTALATSLVRDLQICRKDEPCTFTPVIVSGGVKPYAFAMSASPERQMYSTPGLSIDPATGVVSGTPTGAGTQHVEVRVTDAANAASSKAFDLAVEAGPLSATLDVTYKSCNVGVACNLKPVSASGGAPPYGFTLTGGPLPNGLTFDPYAGTIGGTATVAADVSFTITVTDGARTVLTKGPTRLEVVKVDFPKPPPVATLVLPVQYCAIGASCAFTPVTASGGTPPYTFAASGTLPAGMSFNAATGAFSGTPTAASTTTFTITVTDAAGGKDSKEAQLIVAAPAAGPALNLISGANQQDTIGAMLPQDLVLEVIGRSGQPEAGVEVLFEGWSFNPGLSVMTLYDAATGGPFRNGNPKTNASGRVSVRMALQNLAGTGQVRVTVPYYQLAQTYSFTALPGRPAHITLATHDTTVATGGAVTLRAGIADRVFDVLTLLPTFTAVGSAVSADNTGQIRGQSMGETYVRVSFPGLTSDSAHVVVAPDGLVAFLNGSSAVVSDLGGANPRVLAGNASSVAWLKGTDRLIVAGGGSLVLVDPVGRVTPIPLPGVSNPDWPESKDGSWIYFQGALAGEGRAILRVHPDGSGLARVSQLDGAGMPSPSPDGSRVAYVKGTGALAVLDVGTAAIRDLPVSSATTPRWSPDGSWIAYVVPDSGELRLIHPDGTGLKRVGPHGLYPGISWSPDSGWIIGLEHGLTYVDVTAGTMLNATWSANRPAWKP